MAARQSGAAYDRIPNKYLAQLRPPGAGSGLGRDIALGLAEKRYAVFGTAIAEAEVQDLKSASGWRVSLALCDITKEQDVKAWAGRVSAALGDGRRLDLLISNAGILTPGPGFASPLIPGARRAPGFSASVVPKRKRS